MAFQSSPGVVTQEVDATTNAPGVSTTIGGYAGNFQWGPIGELFTVATEDELVSRVFKPDANTFLSFFTAANFLSYTNNLKLARLPAAGMLNSTANTSGVLIKNETDYTENYSTGANTRGMWAAKYAGDLGNTLKVSSFHGSNTTTFASWAYNGYFDSAPGTSSYTSNLLGYNDEMHVVVVDEDGKFSGTPNTVLERYAFISKASDAILDDGTSNYYKNVINSKSKYIWWLAHGDAGIGVANASNWGSTAAGTTFGSTDNVAYTVSLANGVYASAASGNVTSGYDIFKSGEASQVSLLMMGPHNNVAATYVISNVAESQDRQDLIVFYSPPRNTVVNNAGSEETAVIADRNNLPSSSYLFIDSGWKYQLDKYNDTYRWIPLNGDIAGIAARSDYEKDAWWSFAGYNRGSVKNVVKLAWNPSKANMDNIYKKGINPVVTFDGRGTYLFGDKTALTKPSAFDRINVRRLFIVLKKSISETAKSSLFEFNNAFTRAQFVSQVEPFLRDIQGRSGIYDFRVVCDESNNTPERIDRNEFWGDIYVKPARSINFITLRFVAVRTGVSFDEIVGRV